MEDSSRIPPRDDPVHRPHLHHPDRCVVEVGKLKGNLFVEWDEEFFPLPDLSFEGPPVGPRFFDLIIKFDNFRIESVHQGHLLGQFEFES